MSVQKVGNAWIEGSTLGIDRYPIAEDTTFHSGWDKHEYTFAVAVTGYEADFPTLTRAAHRTVPAVTPEIEWLDQNGPHKNFTQIFRTPWSQAARDTEDRREEFLHEHLSDIEWALVHGTPQEIRNAWHVLRFVGGTTHFLGREEVGPDDHVVLRPLAGRELQYRTWLNPGGSRTSEWLSEVTLEVGSPAR